MSKQNSNIPSPPKHGRVTAGAPGQMGRPDLKKHLAVLTQHALEVKTYGGHPGSRSRAFVTGSVQSGRRVWCGLPDDQHRQHR
jgi:hypothetical protein